MYGTNSEQSCTANVKNHNVYALCSLLLVFFRSRPIIFLPKIFLWPHYSGPRSSGAPVHWTAWTSGSFATDSHILDCSVNRVFGARGRNNEVRPDPPPPPSRDVGITPRVRFSIKGTLSSVSKIDIQFEINRFITQRNCKVLRNGLTNAWTLGSRMISVCCERLPSAHSANFIKLAFVVVKIFFFGEAVLRPWTAAPEDNCRPCPPPAL